MVSAVGDCADGVEACEKSGRWAVVLKHEYCRVNRIAEREAESRCAGRDVHGAVRRNRRYDREPGGCSLCVLRTGKTYYQEAKDGNRNAFHWCDPLVCDVTKCTFPSHRDVMNHTDLQTSAEIR